MQYKSKQIKANPSGYQKIQDTSSRRAAMAVYDGGRSSDGADVGGGGAGAGGGGGGSNSSDDVGLGRRQMCLENVMAMKKQFGR
ncbi:unnamed protein product [Enterobius vermicularis]|uniref:Uncharacterized protein n=1 Tax=Enterobius vermicularis TaxID=51028 RepID=A0A0N4UX30_ENTVE|nr:unnamed protein product [Enterobius vermicularis]